MIRDFEHANIAITNKIGFDLLYTIKRFPIIAQKFDNLYTKSILGHLSVQEWKIGKKKKSKKKSLEH